ncbi:MAG: polyphenol oxidase family protein [Acidimicrobiales bacterium]
MRLHEPLTPETVAQPLGTLGAQPCDQVSTLGWDIFEGTGIQAATPSRHGGVSQGPYRSLNLALHVGDSPEAVAENRRRAAGALDSDPGQLVLANQVHSNRAVVIGSRLGGPSRRIGEIQITADALVTSSPGVLVGVLVADCAPVVLFDPKAGVLACAHAGWRGAFSGIVQSTLLVMASLGACAAQTLAGIGPTVPPERYEVGTEVITAAEGALGDPSPFLSRSLISQRTNLDLAAAVRSILVRSGVPAGQIELSKAHSGPPFPFFSARASAGPCGRFAALARIAR